MVDNKNINLSLVSIVAIVAIVGLFVMIDSNSQQFSQDITEEENLIGQALKMPSKTIPDIGSVKDLSYSKEKTINSEGGITKKVYLKIDPLKDENLDKSCNSFLNARNEEDSTYHLEIIEARISSYSPETQSLMESLAIISVFDHNNPIYTTQITGSLSLTNSLLGVMLKTVDNIKTHERSWGDFEKDSSESSLVETVNGFIKENSWSIGIRVADFVAPGFGTAISLIKYVIDNGIQGMDNILLDMISSVWGEVIQSISIINKIFDVMNFLGFDIYNMLGVSDLWGGTPTDSYNSEGYDPIDYSSSYGDSGGHDPTDGSSSSGDSGSHDPTGGSDSSGGSGASDPGGSELPDNGPSGGDGWATYEGKRSEGGWTWEKKGEGGNDNEDEGEGITPETEWRMPIIQNLFDSLNQLGFQHNLEFTRNEITMYCTNYYQY